MRFKSFFTARLLGLSAVLLSSVLVAQAYTLVMKSGRRLEVDNNFVISGSTVVCQINNGFSVSFQLESVDIPATEHANNEVPGSFLKRNSPIKRNDTSQPPAATKAKTSVTNRDLEGYRRRRVQSEIAYEKRRKELGIPAPTELSANADELTEPARETSLGQSSREQNQEEYWRSRARDLRSEIAATDAQIDYAQSRLNEMQSGYVGFGSNVLTIPGYPYVHSRVSPNLGPVFMPGPHIIPQTPQIIAARRYPTIGPRAPWGGWYPPYRYQNRPGYGFPLPLYSYSDTSSSSQAMSDQLDQLRMQRVRLMSLWRDLEEEARRAGAYPGWLRP